MGTPEKNQENLMRLDEIPLLGLLAKKVDKMVGQLGLYEAARELVRESATKLEVKNQTSETQDILRNKPAVVVYNHPYDAEPAALIASLPPRADISLVTTETLLGLGNNLAKYFLPIYYTEQSKIKKEAERFFKIPEILRVRFSPVLNEFEKAKKNWQTLKLAAQRVINGSLVGIAPEGSWGKEKKWFTGIGHLLKEISSDTDAYFVRVYIKGTSDLDILRLFHLTGTVLPKIEVVFDTPKKIADLLQGNPSAKEITSREEASYKSWVTSIERRTL